MTSGYLGLLEKTFSSPTGLPQPTFGCHLGKEAGWDGCGWWGMAEPCRRITAALDPVLQGVMYPKAWDPHCILSTKDVLEALSQTKPQVATRRDLSVGATSCSKRSQIMIEYSTASKT